MHDPQTQEALELVSKLIETSLRGFIGKYPISLGTLYHMEQQVSNALFHAGVPYNPQEHIRFKAVPERNEIVPANFFTTVVVFASANRLQIPTPEEVSSGKWESPLGTLIWKEDGVTDFIPLVPPQHIKFSICDSNAGTHT